MANASLSFNIFGKDVSAGKALKGVGDKAKGTGDNLGKMGRAGRVAIGGVRAAALPAAAVMAGLAVAAVDFAKASLQDQKGAALLAASLTKVTGASAEQIASVEDWISAQGRALGVADDDLRPALSRLVTATGDVATAQSLAGTAMDVSAATGKPLATVSAALAKAAAGQTSALSRLVPGLDASVLKSGNLADIQAELADKMGGAAATAADTAAGRMQRLDLAVSETKESVGAALLPVIETLLPKLQSMAEFIQDNSRVIAPIAGIIAGFAAAIIVLNAAISAWTAVQWLLNTALLANPITWIVLAIVGLIAAVVLMYNKVDWFRAFVDTAFAAIKAAIAVAVEWFKNTAWPIIKRIIGFIVNYYKFLWSIVSTVFKGIVAAIKVAIDWFKNTAYPRIKAVLQAYGAVFSAVWDAAKAAWESITEKWSAAVSFFSGLRDSLAGTFSGMWDGITSAFRSAINTVIGWWNNLNLSMPSITVGGQTIGGWSLGTPDIPYLANGGIVNRATLAVIGEAGPEAVVPLSRANGLGGNVTINVNAGMIGNRDDVARAVVEALREAKVRGMKLNIA